MLVQYEPETFKSLWMLRDGDKLHFKTTIPMFLAEKIIEENKEKAKHFNESGGWSRAKGGAVVANIPEHIDHYFKLQSGFDPTKSGWYDRDKYNSFLDDSDYAAFRTGGGKIGRKKREVVVQKTKLAAIIGAP